MFAVLVEALCHTSKNLHPSFLEPGLFVKDGSLIWYIFSGGRHAMALTVDGKVFSWGEGEDGKLGHFSRTYVFMQGKF